MPWVAASKMVALIAEGCWLLLIWPSRSLWMHTVALPARPREGNCSVCTCVCVRYKGRRDFQVYIGAVCDDNSPKSYSAARLQLLYGLNCLNPFGKL